MCPCGGVVRVAAAAALDAARRSCCCSQRFCMLLGLLVLTATFTYSTRAGIARSLDSTMKRARDSTCIEEAEGTTADDGSGERAVPGLKFLGNARLMQPQPSLSVDELASEEIAEHLVDLKRAMAKHGGIGIAAPQVGWWVRAMCFGIEGTNPRYPAAAAIPFQMWINPEIVEPSEQTNFMWEGCLSVPGMRGWVERPKAVTLRGVDEHGKAKEARLEGLAARVAQHELDHLDGILFTSRVPSAEFLVPQASMEDRDSWEAGWPSAGSCRTGLGELCDER